MHLTCVRYSGYLYGRPAPIEDSAAREAMRPAAVARASAGG
jgi:hypothetical protein